MVNHLYIHFCQMLLLPPVSTGTKVHGVANKFVLSSQCLFQGDLEFLNVFNLLFSSCPYQLLSDSRFTK